MAWLLSAWWPARTRKRPELACPVNYFRNTTASSNLVWSNVSHFQILDSQNMWYLVSETTIIFNFLFSPWNVFLRMNMDSYVLIFFIFHNGFDYEFACFRMHVPDLAVAFRGNTLHAPVASPAASTTALVQWPIAAGRAPANMSNHDRLPSMHLHLPRLHKWAPLWSRARKSRDFSGSSFCEFEWERHFQSCFSRRTERFGFVLVSPWSEEWCDATEFVFDSRRYHYISFFVPLSPVIVESGSSTAWKVSSLCAISVFTIFSSRSVLKHEMVFFDQFRFLFSPHPALRGQMQRYSVHIWFVTSTVVLFRSEHRFRDCGFSIMYELM